MLHVLPFTKNVSMTLLLPRAQIDFTVRNNQR